VTVLLSLSKDHERSLVSKVVSATLCTRELPIETSWKQLRFSVPFD